MTTTLSERVRGLLADVQDDVGMDAKLDAIGVLCSALPALAAYIEAAQAMRKYAIPEGLDGAHAFDAAEAELLAALGKESA